MSQAYHAERWLLAMLIHATAKQLSKGEMHLISDSQAYVMLHYGNLALRLASIHALLHVTTVLGKNPMSHSTGVRSRMCETIKFLKCKLPTAPIVFTVAGVAVLALAAHRQR